MAKNMSFIKGLLAVIGVHVAGLLLGLGVTLGVSWLIAWMTGLVWEETAVLFLVCIIWAVVLQKMFMANLSLMLVFLVIASLLAFVGGWLLSLWLPFSFFSASMLPLGATFAFMYYFFADFKEIREELEESWDEDEEMPIPYSRFVQDALDKTGGAIFGYIVANAIYRRIDETPSVKGSMSNVEVQELSVRLADAIALVLRRKPAHTIRYEVTVSGLRGAFNKMGQQPYDGDILELAVAVVNEEMMTNLELADIVRNRRWMMRFEE